MDHHLLFGYQSRRHEAKQPERRKCERSALGQTNPQRHNAAALNERPDTFDVSVKPSHSEHSGLSRFQIQTGISALGRWVTDVTGALKRQDSSTFEPISYTGAQALASLPEVLTNTTFHREAQRLAQQTQVLVLNAGLSEAGLNEIDHQDQIQQALTSLRASHPQGQNHRVMVISLSGLSGKNNESNLKAQVSFWGEQGRLVGSGETEAAELLQNTILPDLLATGELSESSLAVLNELDSKRSKALTRAGVQFGIIDPFTIIGGVTLGAGAISGAVYSWKSRSAKKKWLKDQVDGVNQYLKQIGSVDKVNDKNIFSLYTVELLLAPTNKIDDTKKMDELIGLIWDNLPKEVQTKSETYYALQQTYLKKGLSHPSEAVRQYFIQFFEKSDESKTGFYDAFYQQLRVEKSPALARQLEEMLLKMIDAPDFTLVDEKYRAGLQASLIVEDSPHFKQFLIKAMALPKVYDSTVLDCFLEEIQNANNPELLEIMMQAVTRKITPNDADSLASHLDSSHERLKTLAIKSLTEFKNPDYFPHIWQQAQKDLPLSQNANLKSLYENAIQTLFNDSHANLLKPLLVPGAQPNLQAHALNLLVGSKRAKNPNFVPALFDLFLSQTVKANVLLIQAAILHHVDGSQKKLIFDKLMDANPDIRSLAAGCLVFVTNGEDWPMLYEAYKKETHPEVKKSLGQALNLNTSEATPQHELVNLIGNQTDPLLQALAVKGLKGKGIETLPAIMAALNTMVRPPSLPHGGQPQDQLGRDTEKLLSDNLSSIFLAPVGLTSMGGHIDSKYESIKQDLLPHLALVRQALNSNSKKVQDLSMSILQGYRDTQVVPQLFEMLAQNMVADVDRLRVCLFDLIKPNQWPLVKEKARSENPQVRGIAVESLPFLNLAFDAVPDLIRLLWQEPQVALQEQYDTEILSLLKKLDEKQSVETSGLGALVGLQTSLGSSAVLKTILAEATTSDQIMKTLNILFTAKPKGLRQTVLQRYTVESFEKPKEALKLWILNDLQKHDDFKQLKSDGKLTYLKECLSLSDQEIQSTVLENLKSQGDDFFKNNPDLSLLLLSYLESSDALKKEFAIPLLSRLVFERADINLATASESGKAVQMDPITEFETNMRTALPAKIASQDESTRFYALTFLVKFANKNDIPFLLEALEREPSKRIQDTIEAELFRYTPRNNHYSVFTAGFKASKAPHAKLVLAKMISKHHEKVFDELRDYFKSVLAQPMEDTPVNISHLENVKTFYINYLEGLDRQFYSHAPLTQEQGVRIASLLTIPDENVQKRATHILTRYGFADPKTYPIESVLDALNANVLPEKLAATFRKHVLEERANPVFASVYQAKMNTADPEVKALCMRVLKKLAKPADFKTLDAMRTQLGTLSAESQEDWLNVMRNTPVPAESIASAISTIQVEENEAILQSLMSAICVSPEVTLTQLSSLHQWVNKAERLKGSLALQSLLQKPLEESIIKSLKTPQMTLMALEQVLATSSMTLQAQAIERLRTMECPIQKRFELLTSHIENDLLGAGGQAPVDLENTLIKMQSSGDEQLFLDNLYRMLVKTDAPVLRGLATRLLGTWAQKMNPLQGGAATSELIKARQESLNKAVFQLLKQAVSIDDKSLSKQSIEALSTLSANPAVLVPLLSALNQTGEKSSEGLFNTMSAKTIIVDTLKTFRHQVLGDFFNKLNTLAQATTDEAQDPFLRSRLEEAIVSILHEKGLSNLDMIQVGLNAPSKAIQAVVIAQIKNLLTTSSQTASSVSIDERPKANSGQAFIALLVNYIKSDTCLEPDKALDVLVSTSQADQSDNHNYLLTLLTVSNSKVKQAALQMIGERLRPSDLPTLFRTLNSELAKNTGSDSLLLTTLKTLIVKAGSDDTMLTPLVMELEDATNPIAKQTAVCALEKMGADALPFLLDTLENTERNASNDLLVQDLERSIVGIAQTASPEVALLLKDKLSSDNREFTKLVSLALTQCLSKWEKYTDKAQIEAVLPTLEALSASKTGSSIIRGTASKIKTKLELRLTQSEAITETLG